MKTIMSRAARTLVTAALLLPGLLALSPVPRSAGGVARARQASCPERAPHRAFVQLDSMRRVLICAFTTQAHGGPYTTTPQLRRLGDTLFVSASVSLPLGERVLFPEVTDVPYQAVYGPLPRGTRLRITTRAPGRAPSARVALDTTLNVP
ncbi:MAG: hypothetical protein C0503_12110 [Gemmatimonas sp.]|nr:hypothetical protein [Gemmatimonas sp.]